MTDTTHTFPHTLTLDGRHAVVTGGGRGLGAAIAAALAARGASVTVMGRTEAAMAHVASGLRRAQAVVCDVTDGASVAVAFEAATGAYGPVHILINNAGQSSVAAVPDIVVDDMQRLLAVNVVGALRCMQRVLPGMMEARAGRIVTIASTAALKGFATLAAYCASKHAVVGLTRAAALEVARQGITVNAVCPGYVDDTDMLRTAVSNVMRAKGQSEDEARGRLARLSPRGTLVTTAEVADAVLWLCSAEASAVTGQAIAVAGGEVM